jgi:hypothetical protein
MTDQSDDGGTTAGEDQPPIELPDREEAGRANLWGRWRNADPEESTPHSALVGFMSVPVHRRFPIRRSTLLMAVAFLGFGTLCYLYPPGAGGTVINTSNGTFFIPNGTSVSTTTTTTTTRPPATTTTTRPPGPSTTTSTRPNSTSTTTTSSTTTTTTTSGSSTTSTVKVQPTTTTTTGPVGSSGSTTVP